VSDIMACNQAEIELRHAREQAAEALEQQAATEEILRVISSTPADLEPVFRVILANASRLCQADVGAVFMFDGEMLTSVAQQNASNEFAEIIKRAGRRPSRETTTRRCALERRIVHTADLMNDPDYAPPDYQLRENLRAALSVPMQRDDKLIGIITLWRHIATPFTDRQIALLQTFASQAVLAIENVRLFNETREALEQQKASAEVLEAISGSIADTAPVFDKILESCERLFGGQMVGLNLVGEDGLLHSTAYHGARGEEFQRRFPVALDERSSTWLAITERRVVHIPDVEHGVGVPSGTQEGCRTLGIKSVLHAPLLLKERGIGSIFVGRDQAGQFSEKEIALLKTFADQAAIAIENVRLFNETREALEQQKASAEVLGAISRSISDTAPVFDKILESCEHLFAGRIVGLHLVGEDGMLHMGAYYGPYRKEFERTFPYPMTAESGSGLSIMERRVIYFPDTEHGEGVPAKTRLGCKTVGIKSVLFAPMLWEGQGIGAIWVGRDHVSSFTEKEIALLKTFADQAAIALGNVRLFNEIQEKNRQLEIASRHKSEFLANMSHELRTPLNAIIGFTRIVMRRAREQIEVRQYENLEKILASGQHLLTLINSILDLAKVEAGRVEVNPGEIDLCPVLESCVRTIEPLIKRGVTLIRAFDRTLPPLYVDEEKLRQIVINLLSNAAKFTAHGSIRVRAQASNDTVVIDVSDSGIGIAPDKLEVIFEEFAQADASRTRVYGGTGLGLTIARRLARLMGGDITAQSVLDSGSTFTLTLPLRYATPNA
jgi:signal transduction histidine kinase